METEKSSHYSDSREYEHIAKWTVFLTPFYALASKLYYDDTFSTFLLIVSLAILLGFSWSRSDFFKKNGKSFFLHILTSMLSVICCAILGGVLSSQIEWSRCGPMTDCGFYVGYGDPYLIGGDMLFVASFVLVTVLGGGWVVMKFLRRANDNNDLQVEKPQTEATPLKPFAVFATVLLVLMPVVAIPMTYNARVKAGKESTVYTAPPPFVVPSGNTYVPPPTASAPATTGQPVPLYKQIVSTSSSAKEKQCALDVKTYMLAYSSLFASTTGRYSNMKFKKSHYNLEYAMCLAEFSRQNLTQGEGNAVLLMNIDRGTEIIISVPPDAEKLHQELVGEYMNR